MDIASNRIPSARYFQILSLLFFLSTVPFSPMDQALAETFYIDPSSTDTGDPDGSIDRPFKTWDDIPWVAHSTYLQKRGTLCETNRAIRPTVDDITLGAYGEGVRPIIRSLIGDRAKAIEFGRQSITIQDLEVYSTNDIVCAILLGGTGPHVIDNCLLHDCAWGIRIFNVTGKITIRNTEIYDIGDDGIFTKNTEDIDVHDCHIHHVNADLPTRPTAGGDCIQITGQQGKLHIYNNILDHSAFGRKFCLIIGSAYPENDEPHDALVEHNVLIGYRGNEEVTSGVYLKKSINHLTFRYNTVKDASTGIWLNSDTIAHNNIFSGCSEGVILNSGITLRLYHNTLLNNVTGVKSSYGSIGYLINNIFVRGPQTESYLSLFGDITSDHNCFSEEGNGLFNGLETLVSWQANQLRDHHSLVGDPRLINTDENNYRLQATSPCIDHGTYIDEAHFNGEASPAPHTYGPDAGAFEATHSLLSPQP
jgi:hypothetical protein